MGSLSHFPAFIDCLNVNKATRSSSIAMNEDVLTTYFLKLIQRTALKHQLQRESCINASSRHLKMRKSLFLN